MKSERKIEWAFWANELAVDGGLLSLIGGVIGAPAWFVNWEFAAACIPLSLLTLLVEWPRTCRQNRKTQARPFHSVPTAFVRKLKPVTTNYYVRVFWLAVVSIPANFLLPTMAGGLTTAVAAVIYLVAAIKNESWQETKSECQMDGTPRLPRCPSHPPARINIPSPVSSTAVTVAEKY